MPEKKVPEVDNEIDETNTIKETEYVSAIDFAVLDSQNPDVVAWIQIPGTQINYPVVQGKDNDYYLHRFWTMPIGQIFRPCIMCCTAIT